MNIRVAVVLLLSFAKLFYNEVVAGRIELDMQPGRSLDEYLSLIQEAIDTLDEAVQKL